MDRTVVKDEKVEEMTYTGSSNIMVEHKKRKTCFYMNPLTTSASGPHGICYLLEGSYSCAWMK